MRLERLQPDREVLVQPYQGTRKNFRLFHTSYLIGNGADCDLRIDDPFLSTHHARIRLRDSGAGYEVEDLGSKNGVFVNGLRVERAFLPTQGTLRIGRSLISWRDPEDSMPTMLDWVCEDPFFRETLERLRKIAHSDLPILLLGETGTGKDILANFIHQASANANGPFVAINSANAGGSLADSELFGHKKGAYTGSENKRLGAIMSAHRGTLFLDEIGDLSLETQVKLLRTLENGEVKALGSDTAEHSKFRVVSATSLDIEDKIAHGVFRLDLYYRIAGYVVHVPALRDRPKDILAIAKKVLEQKHLFLAEECRGALLSYEWPGNVRELKSVIERAAVIARAENSTQILCHHLIFSSALKHHGKITDSTQLTLEASEKKLIFQTLEKTGWSKVTTARNLGIARSTLFEKMRKYGIRNSLN